MKILDHKNSIGKDIYFIVGSVIPRHVIIFNPSKHKESPTSLHQKVVCTVVKFDINQS